MIVKSIVHSENFNVLYACIFRYDSEFSLSLRNFCMIAKITKHCEIFASCFCVQTTPFWVFSFLPL